MKILMMPDSFKGSLSAKKAATILGEESLPTSFSICND